MNHDSPADLSSDGATSQDASLDRVSLSAGPALSSSPRPPGLRKQDKRKTLFEDLIRSLDILVYIELSAIYYMDCSFFRLFIRALPQYLYLSPKPPNFPVPPHIPHRHYISVLSFSNIVIFLLHIVSAAPAAGEAVRGYLHGGLLTDFVGQLGPTSKFRLGVMDLGIFLLQLTMLWIVVEKKELEAVMGGGVETFAPSWSGAGRQDLDAEEQGLSRDDDNMEREEGIELLPLPGSGDGDGLADAGNSLGGGAHGEDHPLDAFHTGQYVVTDIHIVETVRRAWDWR